MPTLEELISSIPAGVYTLIITIIATYVFYRVVLAFRPPEARSNPFKEPLLVPKKKKVEVHEKKPEPQEAPKTNGIPNYMLRTSGTVTCLHDDSSAPAVNEMVQDLYGVLFERDRLVSIVTSDVIDMVQQEVGPKVDYLGENILVQGLLFDDFKVADKFVIASADDFDPDASGVLNLEILEPRPAHSLNLDQLGDDDSQRKSITSMLSMASGFCGWTARVKIAGRVRSGFKIAKRSQVDSPTNPEPAPKK